MKTSSSEAYRKHVELLANKVRLATYKGRLVDYQLQRIKKMERCLDEISMMMGKKGYSLIQISEAIKRAAVILERSPDAWAAAMYHAYMKDEIDGNGPDSAA